MARSHSTIASPPGATIKEQLVSREMNQKEFAQRMDMSEKHISKLINGEVLLTSDMARRLELVLGIPAQFWCRLESIYREKLCKVDAENKMDADKLLVRKIPYNEMAKNGWVPRTNNTIEKVVNLRKYFEVVQLGIVPSTPVPGIACRRFADHEKADLALYAWAQKARLEAREIDTRPIDIDKLIKTIPTIRRMTTEAPNVFCTELVNRLAECGIAIVFLPHIGGSFLHGATFKDGRKIVMGLTVRGKDADRFWFSLFHELAHIIHGHINQQDGPSEEEERVADEYAKEVLIPSPSFHAFVKEQDFSRSAILSFAGQLGIDAGIVVGRLQKEGYIDFSWHHDLKTQYSISS